MPSRNRASGNVKVSVGHISGTSREYEVPRDTTVKQLLEKLNITLNEGEEILNNNAENVNVDSEVSAGMEYIVSSNMKAF